MISIIKDKIQCLIFIFFLIGCAPISDPNLFFTEQIPSTGILETKPQN